jgi:hypothetical protein
MNVVKSELRSGSERHVEEDGVVVDECSPVTCEGNAEWAGFYFNNFSFVPIC